MFYFVLHITNLNNSSNTRQQLGAIPDNRITQQLKLNQESILEQTVDSQSTLTPSLHWIQQIFKTQQVNLLTMLDQLTDSPV